MNKIYRTIEDNSPYKEYDHSQQVTTLNTCHWGQLKLFYTELEFLTICSKYFDMSKCVVVYIGSAPGHHTGFLTELFPELHWILYDPAPFVIKESNKVQIFTDKDGFFTDDTVAHVKNNKRTHGKHILFISDIRLKDNDEDKFEGKVWDDMLNQQKWTIQLNSSMAMLKFRLPYVFDNKINININYKPLPNTKISKKYPKNDMSVLYLEGDIYIQINPPVHSTETRLIVKQNDDKTYNMRYYDFKKYEGQCFYFNNIDRIKKKFTYKDSKKLANHIAGFDDSYDRVSEYFIWVCYFEYYLKSKYDFNLIVKYIYNFHEYLNKITGKSIVKCKMVTFDKFKDRRKERLIEGKDKFMTEFKELKASLQKQIKLMENRKNNILEKSEYNSQLILLKNTVNEIDEYVKKIFIPYVGK